MATERPESGPVFDSLVAAIREADQAFENGGDGGTRHYVRDFLNPALERQQLAVVNADLEARLREAERQTGEVHSRLVHTLQEKDDLEARLREREAEAERLRLGQIDRARLPIPQRRLIERAEEAEARLRETEEALRGRRVTRDELVELCHVAVADHWANVDVDPTVVLELEHERAEWEKTSALVARQRDEFLKTLRRIEQHPLARPLIREIAREGRRSS